MLTAALAGFALSFSLILAIGAQNAFVLRQGLRRAHVGPVVAICCASEAVLIFTGVAGFGALAQAAPWALDAMRWGGALFLVGYSVKSFLAAWRANDAMAVEGGRDGTRWAAMTTALILTWANPHVYLDTVGLIGAVAAQYGPARWAFGAGALMASCVFFVLLGYGARALAPLFARPGAWRVLDGLVGATMLTLAVKLVFFP